ncbi:DUF4017 family protein [Hazenella coriacea]|uniref:Uncharacterized protein DUF4017 n=1 Tax=Hazenella coriacea TaxID=1179467 RepID=A0A4R3LAN6_9BACL|nr:DUF4017 family protein [Hazenella coriacea]TCS96772.1 uncharacterized protein DUF4017 [Hazenella coriacea]
MKIMLPSLLAYLIVCVIAVLVPSSEGYNTIVWKLLVGQIYAIPTLLIVTLISYYINKKISRNKIGSS